MEKKLFLCVKGIFIVCLLQMCGIVNNAAAQINDVSIIELPSISKLPVMSIHRIFQDSEGYVWYATVDGLCRDDGYKVHTFRNTFDTPGLMGINLVTAITEDKDGNIWFGTMKGIYRLEKETYRIVRIMTPELYSVPIQNIICQKDGALWVVADKHLVRITTSGKVIADISVPHGLNHLIDTHEGELLIALGGGGLAYVGKGDDKLKTITSSIDASYLIYDSHADCYWISTYDRKILKCKLLNHRILAAVEQVIAPLEADGTKRLFTSLVQDDKTHRIWATTSDNLYAFSTDHGRLTELDTKNVLPDEKRIIVDLYKNKEGDIWAAGFDCKSFIISNSPDVIVKIPTEAMKAHSGLNPTIVTLCRDDDGWIWYYQERKGLYLYNAKEQKVVSYKECKAVSQLPLDVVPYLIKSGDHNSIWAIAGRSNIIKLSRTEHEIILDSHIDLSHYTKKTGQLECIFEDRKGDLWISTISGLYVVRNGSRRATVVSEDIGNISDFCQTTDGTIWASVRKQGICSISSDGKYHVYPNEMDFLTLDASTDGTIWAGTDEGCVVAFNPKSTPQYSDYTVRAGMNGDMVDHIKVDDHNHLWIVTNQCVREFNPRNGAFRAYFASDPQIPLFRYMPRAVFKDKDGQILFGGMAGIIALRSSMSLESMAKNVKTHISDVKVSGKSVWFDTIHRKTADAIELASDERYVSIEFSSLHFRNINRIRYAYRIKGLDKEWNYLPVGENVATYSNLPKGKHKLEVKSTDENGLWSDNITTFTLNRLPAWYESWWAYIIYILLVATLLGTILRLYTYWIKEQKERQAIENLLRAKQLELMSATKTVANPEEEKPQTAQVDVTKTRSIDDEFLAKTMQVVEKNLSNPMLDVNYLASEMNMSRSTFTRKIKAVAGQTPLDFIKSIKLKHAYRMLQDKTATIQFVMESIGYQDHKTFTASFKEAFGITPSERLHRKEKE